MYSESDYNCPECGSDEKAEEKDLYCPEYSEQCGECGTYFETPDV